VLDADRSDADLRRIVREAAAEAIESAVQPMRDDLRALELSIGGDGGLRDRLIRVETELHFQTRRGRDRTPRPPPSGGDTSDALIFRGAGWSTLARWLIAALLSTLAGSGATWYAMQEDPLVVPPHNRSAPVSTTGPEAP
jgi:hypothetical protein